VSTVPPSSATNKPLPNAADVGGGRGKSKLRKVWTVEEEEKLVSVVETFGTDPDSWAEIAVNVPGRNESQCRSKWSHMSIKAAAAAGATTSWTAEEEQKLASAVLTYGGRNWDKIAAKVTGRNENQCSAKWNHMSKKAAATAKGTWTVEEEKRLASAVKTYGGRNWDKIAAKVTGRTENQCSSKWWNHVSNKAAATASGTLTAEEEESLSADHKKRSATKSRTPTQKQSKLKENPN
jgi:myb proto-oncogene protein